MLNNKNCHIKFKLPKNLLYVERFWVRCFGGVFTVLKAIKIDMDYRSIGPPVRFWWVFHLSSGWPGITRQSAQSPSFHVINPLLGIDPEWMIGQVHKAECKSMFPEYL